MTDHENTEGESPDIGYARIRAAVASVPSSEYDAIRATIAGVRLSDRALYALYTEFCNIQAANWLVVDKESMDRFKKWIETGDELEAWT
jgi:hypothetical protein